MPRDPLEGYEYLGGTERHWLTPEGEEISRRQYENEWFAERLGYESWSDYQGLRDDPVYERWLEVTAENLGISEDDLRAADSEFNAAYLEARADDWDPSAGGSFADFLEDWTGEREDDAGYDVGDTPGETG